MKNKLILLLGIFLIILIAGTFFLLEYSKDKEYSCEKIICPVGISSNFPDGYQIDGANISEYYYKYFNEKCEVYNCNEK
jgi:hypothetical protein